MPGATTAPRKARRRKPLPVRKAAVLVARALDATRGEDIVVLEVGELSPLSECFVLATGTNPRHVTALAEEAERSLKALDIRPSGREGVAQGYWAVLDYGPLLVHVFDPKARAFYDLDMLWGDGKKVRWRAPKPKSAAEQ